MFWELDRARVICRIAHVSMRWEDIDTREDGARRRPGVLRRCTIQISKFESRVLPYWMILRSVQYSRSSGDHTVSYNSGARRRPPAPARDVNDINMRN